MDLGKTLGLRQGFQYAEHEALLSLYYTAAIARKKATEFFKQFHLTDVQFNLLMLLKYQSGAAEGLSQIELSRMMLVNRANITSLLDRMEKAGLIERTETSVDRRYKIVRLLPKGAEALRQAEEPYYEEVMRIMGSLDALELQRFSGSLERIREQLDA